jgi:hypothetical protein
MLCSCVPVLAPCQVRSLVAAKALTEFNYPLTDILTCQPYSCMRAALTDVLPDVAADLLSIVVFLTPAGTRDEGGVIQPAYLNFDAALLAAPAHDLKVWCHTISLAKSSPSANSLVNVAGLRTKSFA